MMMESMDRLAELSSTWLSLLALATWRALPILLLVVAIGLAFRRRIAPSIHALLWTIVVARFLLPFSLEVPWSIHGPIDAWTSNSMGITTAPLKNTASYNDRQYEKPATLPTLRQTWYSPAPPPHVVPSTTANWEGLLGYTLISTVLFVTGTLLVRNVFSHTKFAIKLRSCRILSDQAMVDLLLRECDALGAVRRPTVREVPHLEAPAVFGLIRPTICLPRDFRNTVTDQELRWVVRHELAHIRRRDTAVMFMASIANACHWFNPLMWFAKRRLWTSIESAADRLALTSLAPEEAASYGQLLLRLAEKHVVAQRQPTLGLLPFASGRHLKQRVESLMRRPSSRRGLDRAITLSLVATLIAGGLTDARELNPAKAPEVYLLPDSSSNLVATRVDRSSWTATEKDGPSFTKSYDVNSILRTMEMPHSLSENSLDLKSKLLAWLPIPKEIGEAMKLEGEILTAELNAGQHEMLARTLNIWKNGEPRQITIETQFVQTNLDLASSIDWAKHKLESLVVEGPGPAIAAQVHKRDLQRFLSSVVKDPNCNILSSPKVTCYDGQTATIADLIERPFVTGVEPKKDGVLQPVVSLIDEGLRFSVTPQTHEGNDLLIAFEVNASSIGKVSYANLPIRRQKKSEPHLTVQVPTTHRYSIRSNVQLDSDQSIVVAIPHVFDLQPGSDANGMTIIAFTPTILPIDTAASE